MNDIDDKILAALRDESKRTNDDYTDELGLFGLIGQSFKGAFRWVVITAFALILIFIGIGVYCAVNFVHATDLATKLNWLGGSGLAFLIVVALRIWYFMELNRLSIRREIKRVELQLALLAAKLESATKS